MILAMVSCEMDNDPFFDCDISLSYISTYTSYNFYQLDQAVLVQLVVWKITAYQWWYQYICMGVVIQVFMHNNYQKYIF